jgi:tetratricopeptide (TPR) repeat protein
VQRLPSSFALQEALSLHQRGAIREAAERYSEILARDPRNPEVLFWLGLACTQEGNFGEAGRVLRKAIKVAPQHAGLHNLMATALKGLGKYDLALEHVDRAIALQPLLLEAYSNRASLLLSLHRPDEAAATCERIVSLAPGDFVAWNVRGNVLAATGRHVDAIASFDQALAIAPHVPELHANRGASLAALGRHEDAVASFDSAIKANPGFAEVFVNRGNSLARLGRDDDALVSYDRAIAVRPDFAEAHLSRGFILQGHRRYDEALESLDRAIALDGTRTDAMLARADILLRLRRLDEALVSGQAALKIDSTLDRAWQLRGQTLHQLGRYEEALTACNRALALRPGEMSLHQQRARILIDQRRFEDALAEYDRSITLDPDNAEPYADRAALFHALGRFDEALIDMKRSLALAPDDDNVLYKASFIERAHGDWLAGSKKYERRLAMAGDFEPPPYPRWAGEKLDRELLLLIGEQGLGDRIQFACYVPDLFRAGYRIAVLTDPQSAELLRSMPGIQKVFSTREVRDLGEDLRWLPIASLPYVMQTTPGTVPRTAPYLRADAGRLARWRSRLGTSGFKIGIAWQGNPESRFDSLRSIPLQEFAPLASISDVRLVSLQKRPAADQIATVAFGDRIETILDDADFGPESLLETAALMTSLDLIITSDTMIAHLAGALGCRTFLALSRAPDWRWLLDRADCPWYPSLRLFRQKTVGNWNEVFARIAENVEIAAQ